MSLSALSGTSSIGPGNGGGGAPVALQAKLAQCERQLGDWQACPSGKTPEGKRIIENLQSQIRNIESRMADADSVNARSPSTGSSGSALSSAPVAARPVGLGAIGGLVDVFA
ncbi:hypothetical protein [Rhodoferax sp. GW822-FHT02A01]|uniref:hypothetical protein n=1 Tax=Rhodoferax sp. GW822-FHT02A01 TaxID=3141537 RepID=UPI00315DEF74